MSDKLNLLRDDDVLCTSSSSLMFQCTFKVSEYLTIIQTKLEAENLFGEGLECQLLRPNKPWIKGKIKLRLEFEPAEGEVDIFEEKTDEDNNGQPDKFVPVSPTSPDADGLEEIYNRRPSSLGMWS